VTFNDALKVILQHEGGLSLVGISRTGDAEHNLSRMTAGNFKQTAKLFVRRFISRVNILDRPYKLVGIFAKIVQLAMLPIKALPSSVVVVLLKSCPLKIGNMIVGLVSVLVVDRHSIFLRSEESLCHQAVDEFPIPTVERDGQISMVPKGAFKKGCFYKPPPTVFVDHRAFKPTNSSEVRHLVSIFKSTNAPPFLSFHALSPA